MTVMTAAMLLFPGTYQTGTLQEDEIIEAAKKHVPEECEYVQMKKDDGYWEVEFICDRDEYEVTLTDTGKVIEVEFEAEESRSTSFVISETEAESIISEKFTDTEITLLRRKEDDEDGCLYKIRFESDAYRGKTEINAGTGMITEYEIHYLQTDRKEKSASFSTFHSVEPKRLELSTSSLPAMRSPR